MVGTLGWSDLGFEEWYPPGLPSRDRLAWSATRFEGVEVDSTFYALPTRRTVARSAEITPPDFTFDVKLHRLLYHHATPLTSVPTDLRERAKLAESGRVMLDPQIERADTPMLQSHRRGVRLCRRAADRRAARGAFT